MFLCRPPWSWNFTGMLCLYPADSPAAFPGPDFCEMGIWLRADGFRWLYSTIAAFMWMMTTLFSMEYFARRGNRGRYCFFFPVNLRGNHGRISVRQPVLLFLFFEIMGLTSFVMVIQEETEAAGRAARTTTWPVQLPLCALSSGIFMIAGRDRSIHGRSGRSSEGHRGTWPLYLAWERCCLPDSGRNAGMYPLHVWLPNAHPVAPAPASPASQTS